LCGGLWPAGNLFRDPDGFWLGGLTGLRPAPHGSRQEQARNHSLSQAVHGAGNLWPSVSSPQARSIRPKCRLTYRSINAAGSLAPSRSLVDDDWQCGHFMTGGSFAKRAREPIRRPPTWQAAPKADGTADLVH
jgi:hypothetical protein